MPLNHLLNSLEKRVPWGTAGKMLRDLGLSRGRGWSNTRPKLEEQLEDNQHGERDLRAALIEHIIAGEKIISFYEADNDILAELKDYFRDPEIEKNTFPYLMTKRELDATPLGEPKLVAVKDVEGSTAAIFSSVRFVEVTEKIDLDDGEDANRLERYSEVVGIRRERSQAFDILWLPRSGRRIEVRVDAPKGIPHEAAIAARQQLVGMVESDVEVELPKPTNLFPLIKRIYDDPTEGEVVDLAFHTSTASLKHERMRRRRSCLRQEIYHRAGKRALTDDISAFRMSVQWPISHGTSNVVRPELSLNGTVHMVHEPRPYLGEATLRGCTGLDDYEFVRRKIIHHLSHG